MFLIDSDKKAALDAIAPTYLMNIYQWQIEEIQKGIAEANARDFASDEEVKATFARLTNLY
ncbi:MAG: CopG family transcriptional regulator [Nostoc sp.]